MSREKVLKLSNGIKLWKKWTSNKDVYLQNNDCVLNIKSESVNKLTNANNCFFYDVVVNLFVINFSHSGMETPTRTSLTLASVSSCKDGFSSIL